MSRWTSEPTRRAVLISAGAAGIGLIAGSGRRGADAAASETIGPRYRGGRIRLTLPSPTGRHRVGTTSLHLVDRSRRDPWTSTPRELMISLWYPARNGEGDRVPWMTSAVEALYRQQTSRNLQTSLDAVDFPLTHARRNVPVRARHGGRPVIIFSPGYAAMREQGTTLVEDLASRGNVVVTISHTHEAQFVEFPGGRVEPSRQPADPDYALALRTRRDDTTFVLDVLARLNSGADPTIQGRRLPHGLRGALDLSKVGMFGHSLGGAAAAETMAHDPRVRAGVDLDGSVDGAARDTGLDRPFLLMASAGHGRDNDDSWADFWSHLRGWRRQLLLKDSGHQAYTDLGPLVPQLIKALPIPPQVVARLTENIGTIDPGRSVAAQRAYLAAFFDLHLRRHDDHLFSGPSPRYPEIEFVP
ncbi:alpha/beta hydrolase family protein [Actinomadura decatromicini]|uniref:Lipase n=1 Tax=Actinomadura decatromicini TaxID=2604572 RepID=A0A5D3FTQ0_9ACTN|nr:hypothetical protein [Actinomadura decatromicini]TYK51449.1 hypothetical protein FXF68_13700 [Actinomadura decatromicini]